MHADGRPSGMAFVEFDCPQEAMRALVRQFKFSHLVHAYTALRMIHGKSSTT